MKCYIEFAFDELELKDALRLGHCPMKVDPDVYLKYGTAAVVHDEKTGAILARNENESLDAFRERCIGLFGKKVT